MIRRLIAFAVLMLALASASHAATLYISEFPNAVSQVGSTSPQVYPQAALTDQTVALSGVSAISAAFNAKTHAVLLICDEGCSVNFGGTTATTSNYLLQQGVQYQFAVASGGKVSVIANAAGNSSSGGGGGGAVTLASGAVASGAYSSGSIASGAYASGSISNGADVAQGSTTDTAYSDATGAAAGSINALLKGLYVNSSSTAAIPVTSTQLPLGLGTTTPAQSLAVTQADTGTGTGSVGSATTLFSVDMTGYESISVQVTAIGGANTITYETSDDNSTFYSAAGLVSGSGSRSTSFSTTTSTAAGMAFFPRYGRYFRARVSTWASGTVTAAYTQHKSPFTLSNATSVQGSVAGGLSLSGVGGIPAVLQGRTANVAVTNTQSTFGAATLVGAAVSKPYSVPELEWGQAGLTLTASNQAMVAGGGAGVINYMTAYTISCAASWTANTVEFEQGSTAIWDVQIPAGAGVYNSPVLLNPLKGAATAAINVKATGAVTGTCLVAGSGYAAAD